MHPAKILATSSSSSSSFCTNSDEAPKPLNPQFKENITSFFFWKWKLFLFSRSTHTFCPSFFVSFLWWCEPHEGKMHACCHKPIKGRVVLDMGSLKAFWNWSLYPICKPNNLSKISLYISPILPNSAIFFFFFFFPAVLATQQKRQGEAEEWERREWTGATQSFFSFGDFLLLSDGPSFVSFTYFLGLLFSFYHSFEGRGRWWPVPGGYSETLRVPIWPHGDRWVNRCCAGVWFWITSGSGYLNNVRIIEHPVPDIWTTSE